MECLYTMGFIVSLALRSLATRCACSSSRLPHPCACTAQMIRWLTLQQQLAGILSHYLTWTMLRSANASRVEMNGPPSLSPTSDHADRSQFLCVCVFFKPQALRNASAVAKRAHDARKFTNTGTLCRTEAVWRIQILGLAKAAANCVRTGSFTIRCLTCQQGFVGQQEAVCLARPMRT